MVASDYALLKLLYNLSLACTNSWLAQLLFLTGTTDIKFRLPDQFRASTAENMQFVRAVLDQDMWTVRECLLAMGRDPEL